MSRRSQEVPKVSVYVPDELWDKVKTLAPETGGSQLIQETIREYVDRRERKPYAILSDGLLAQKRAAEKKALDKLAEAYRAGYGFGLRIADDLTWEMFYAFARVDWDFDEFDDETVNGDYRGYQFNNAWTTIARDNRLSEDDWPQGPVREGIVDALKDLWDGLSSTQAPELPAPLVPAPGAREVAPESGPETDEEVVIVPFRTEAEGVEPL